MEANYENINKPNIKWRIIARQFLISSNIWMISVLFGIILGAPTVIIPQLRKEANSTSDDTDYEQPSWASSVVFFGGIPWVLLLVIMTHYIGHKKTLVFVQVIAFIGFMKLYYSTNMVSLIICQALLGIIPATVSTVSNLVLTEYTIPKYRGLIYTIKAGCTFWGVGISNTLGTYLHWTTIAVFGLACTTYMLIVSMCMPDSPYWLASKGKYDECAASHRWIKGIDDDAEHELKNILRKTRANNKQTKLSQPVCINLRQYFKRQVQPSNYKPFFCCCLLICCYDWSGKAACAVYALDLIKKMTGSESAAYTGMLILDGCSIICTYLATCLCKFLTRRTLFLWSMLCTVFCLYALSLYLVLVSYSIITENFHWILFLLICYTISACFGPMIMCVVMYGEILPVFSSITIICLSIITKLDLGIVLKFTPLLMETLQCYGTFLCFGMITLCVTILGYKYIPETKDKTLIEISDHFNSEKSRENEETAPLSKEGNMHKLNEI